MNTPTPVAYPVVLYKGRTARTANSAREAEQFRLEGYAPLQPNLEHPRFVFRGDERLRVEDPAAEAVAAKQGFTRTPPDGLSAEQTPADAAASAVRGEGNELKALLEASNAREDALADKLNTALAANKSLGEQLDTTKAQLETVTAERDELREQVSYRTAPKGKK